MTTARKPGTEKKRWPCTFSIAVAAGAKTTTTNTTTTTTTSTHPRYLAPMHMESKLSTEPENPCPICLDNDDGATVDGNQPGMCTACGQSFCGACNSVSLLGSLLSCPCCRASFHPPRTEAFRQCWKLVHDRSPGRHTPLAQNQLGFMYSKGDGVEPDAVEAATWFRKAAEAGCCDAQCNLGTMYGIGAGVEQDWGKATKWYRTAAEAGHAAAPPSSSTPSWLWLGNAGYDCWGHPPPQQQRIGSSTCLQAWSSSRSL